MRQRLYYSLYILLSLACVGASNTLHAQKREMKGKNLAAYAGTWQYATKTDTFTLVLQTGTKVSEFSTVEMLYGFHYYKKNGKVIDNYLNKLPANQDNFTFKASNAVYAKYYNEINPNRVSATYIDNNKQQDDWMMGRFDLNPDNPKEMTWTLTPYIREGIYVGDPPPPQDLSSTIPEKMVLKKIK